MSDDAKILDDIGEYKYGFHDRDDNYTFKSQKGLSREVVENISRMKGEPQWIKPKPFRWDYTLFGKANAALASPDETIEMTIVKRNAALNGFNQWTLNGEAFSMESKPMYRVHEGRRYRLKFRNASDDIHPLQVPTLSSVLCQCG